MRMPGDQRSLLDRAADAPVSDLHPLSNFLAILVDSQGLFDIGRCGRQRHGGLALVLGSSIDYPCKDRKLTVSEFYRLFSTRVKSHTDISIKMKMKPTIHDNRDLLAMLLRQDVIQQRRLAGSKIAWRHLNTNH